MVTNAAFLNAIFADDLKAGHKVWVTDFPEDPASKQAKNGWKGRCWDGDDFPAAANNAFFVEAD